MATIEKVYKELKRTIEDSEFKHLFFPNNPVEVNIVTFNEPRKTTVLGVWLAAMDNGKGYRVVFNTPLSEPSAFKSDFKDPEELQKVLERAKERAQISCTNDELIEELKLLAKKCGYCYEL